MYALVAVVAVLAGKTPVWAGHKVAVAVTVESLVSVAVLIDVVVGDFGRPRMNIGVAVVAVLAIRRSRMTVVVPVTRTALFGAARDVSRLVRTSILNVVELVGIRVVKDS